MSLPSEGREVILAIVAVGSHGKQLLQLLGQSNVARADYLQISLSLTPSFKSGERTIAPERPSLGRDS
jgi:hypothetical protein